MKEVLMGILIGCAIIFGVVAVLLLCIFVAFLEIPALNRPDNEECCGNCTLRYPMSAKDLEKFPCKSGHRCSIDGCIIPSLDSWCSSYEKDKQNE